MAVVRRWIMAVVLAVMLPSVGFATVVVVAATLHDATGAPGDVAARFPVHRVFIVAHARD